MKDELFQQLTASLKEGGAILRGKAPASRATTLQWPDAKGGGFNSRSADFSPQREARQVGCEMGVRHESHAAD